MTVTFDAVTSAAAANAELLLQTPLGWQKPRQVIYIHRHPDLENHCLYRWNHQEQRPQATSSQDLVLRLQDLYSECRGEFQAQKLILDGDLGSDGPVRLIAGLKTHCATVLLSSFCVLRPDLLVLPLRLRFQAGERPGVVLPHLSLAGEWIDGRSLCRDANGEPSDPAELLLEVQTLLRHGLQQELLPHQRRSQRLQTAPSQKGKS